MHRILPVAAVFAVVGWRAAAFGYPHPAIADLEQVSWSLAIMGLWFLACTLWGYLRRSDRRTAVLLIYGVCSGLHWGGAVGFGDATLEVSLAFYLVVSSIGGQCAFLHLALLGSSNRSLGNSTRLLVYTPLLAGLMLLVWRVLFQAEAYVQPYIFGLVSVASAFGLFGAALWVYGWMRSPSGSTIRFRRAVVVGALLGWVPPAAAMSGVLDWSGMEGLLNLTLAFEPAALAWFFATGTLVRDGATGIRSG